MGKTNICRYRMKTQGVVLCTLCSAPCKNVPKKLCIMTAEYWEENKKLAEAMKPKENE